MKILIIGFSVRHIASSASRAGYEVFAADCYCDLDLEECAFGTARLDSCSEFDFDLAPEKIMDFVDRFSPDAVVLGPGLEETILKEVPALNNPPEKISKISDKLWLARWLEREGYPSIPTETLEEWNYHDSAHPFDLKYNPLMIKPCKGAGGTHNLLIRSEFELYDLIEGGTPTFSDKELIVQEWVDGIPASASVIGNGEEAVAVAVNEQMIGTPWLGAKGFRYCGNITPLKTKPKITAEIIRLGEEIVSDLGLIGSNGVDFILRGDEAVVVEVNPRFQGSLDSVEIATGQNIFEAHVNSFSGKLPQRRKPRAIAGRVILFANTDLKIDLDLRKITDCIADIPRIGTKIERDRPLTSIIAKARKRDDVLELLRKRSSKLQRSCSNI
jgi:predicted ATP-grasp superfamily ATP-dependent carboligase